jgi:hypothetical protein
MSGITMSKELSAMVQVEQALQDLPEEERGRVLAWASSRFGVIIPPPKGVSPKAADIASGDHPEDEHGSSPSEVSSLAEFYDLTAPTSDGEKALVVGYWIQFKEGASELEAQRINSELKHLGHGIGNVTRALETLKAQKPALMIQKRKEGTTKQARKKFVVTNEGKKHVDKMASRP